MSRGMYTIGWGGEGHRCDNIKNSRVSQANPSPSPRSLLLTRQQTGQNSSLTPEGKGKTLSKRVNETRKSEKNRFLRQVYTIDD